MSILCRVLVCMCFRTALYMWVGVCWCHGTNTHVFSNSTQQSPVNTYSKHKAHTHTVSCSHRQTLPHSKHTLTRPHCFLPSVIWTLCVWTHPVIITTHGLHAQLTSSQHTVYTQQHISCHRTFLKFPLPDMGISPYLESVSIWNQSIFGISPYLESVHIWNQSLFGTSPYLESVHVWNQFMFGISPYIMRSVNVCACVCVLKCVCVYACICALKCLCVSVWENDWMRECV